MPFDSDKRSKQASDRPRDGHGHFIPQNEGIKSSTHTTGSAKVISGLFSAEKTDNDDKLINLTVSDPLKKIAQLLKDIKNKQSTTVSMRFTIPLIALPIAFLLAFQMGRFNANCINNYSSKIGVIKKITISRETLVIPFLPESINWKQTVSEDRYLLVNGNNSITLTGYINNEGLQNTPVVATGDYSSCQNSLNLSSLSNIQKIQN